MKILSLDISSSTIGWASMIKENDEINLINYGHIKPMSKKKSLDNLYLRLEDTIKKIENLLVQEQPEQIIIEDYAKKFSRGRSSANTIILLAVFNETVALTGYRHTDKKPIRYTVSELRASVKKKYNASVKGKEEVINFVDSFFEKYQIVKNRVGNTKTECEDEADAILLGIHHLSK